MAANYSSALSRFQIEDTPDTQLRQRLSNAQIQQTAAQAAQETRAGLPEPPLQPRSKPLGLRMNDSALASAQAEQNAALRANLPTPANPGRAPSQPLATRLANPELAVNAQGLSAAARQTMAANRGNALGARLANPELAAGAAAQSGGLRAMMNANRTAAPLAAETTGLRARLANPNTLAGAYENASEAIMRSPTGFGAVKPGYVNPAIESAKRYTTGAMTQGPKGPLNLLNDIVSGPVANGYLADEYNQGKLKEALQNGEMGIATGLRGLFSLASRAPQLAAGQFAGTPRLRPELESTYEGAKNYLAGMFDSQGEPVKNSGPALRASTQDNRNLTSNRPQLDENYVYNVDGSKRYAPLDQAPTLASQGGVSLVTETQSRPAQRGLAAQAEPTYTAQVSRDQFGNLVDADGTIYAGYDNGDPNQRTVNYRNGRRSDLDAANNGQGVRVLDANGGQYFQTQGGRVAADKNFNSYLATNGLSGIMDRDEDGNFASDPAQYMAAYQGATGIGLGAAEQQLAERRLAQEQANFDAELGLNRDKLAFEKQQSRVFDPRKFDPAFNEDALASVPENTAPNEIQRLRATPKAAWLQFNYDYANAQSDTERNSYVAEFSKDSGISPNVIKSLLFRSPNALY